MTLRELAHLLDKEASWRPSDSQGRALDVWVKVRIVDARVVYGRQEVMVEPVAGEGRTWVSVDRVRVKGGKR